jgi:serine/threonine-protein kinase
VPDVAILGRLVNNILPPPSAERPDVPLELEAIILRAMAYDREERYRTAGDLQADLELFLERMGPAPLRDAGRLVAHHFDDERQRIRALIDAQLRDVRALPTDEYRAVSLPVIAQPSHSMPPPPPEGSGPDYGSGPSYGSAPGTGSGPHTGTGPGTGPSYPRPGSLTAANTARSAMPPARSRLSVVLPLALVGVAGLGAGLGLAMRGGGDPAATATTAAAAPAAASPTSTSAAAAPAEVELKVTARPGEARVFLDGKPLEGNPAALRVQRDGAVHTLRVEAPGHLTASRELTFDKDFHIELALERDAGVADQPAGVARPAGRAIPPARPSEPDPAPAAPPAEDDPDMKRPGAKPVRSIDTQNPFANP